MISPELLRRHSFFGGFSMAELKQLALMGREQSVEAGAFLFEEGQRADALYFILDGEMETLVSTEESRERLPLSTIPAGEPLGWSAVIEPHAYTASARATRASRVLAFDRGELARWIEDPHACALLMTKIASLLSGRLRDAQVQLLSFSATPTHA